MRRLIKLNPNYREKVQSAPIVSNATTNHNYSSMQSKSNDNKKDQNEAANVSMFVNIYYMDFDFKKKKILLDCMPL